MLLSCSQTGPTPTAESMAKSKLKLAAMPYEALPRVVYDGGEKSDYWHARVHVIGFALSCMHGHHGRCFSWINEVIFDFRVRPSCFCQMTRRRVRAGIMVTVVLGAPHPKPPASLNCPCGRPPTLRSIVATNTQEKT